MQGVVPSAGPTTRRWRRWTVAGAIVLLAGSAILLFWLREASAGRHLEAAQRAAARRDFIAAQKHLDSWLERYPNHMTGRMLAAQIARRAGFPQEAQVQLDIAAAIDEWNPKIAPERALLELQEGELGHERHAWNSVAAEPDEAPIILEALARGYRKNYLLEDMLSALNELLRRQPDHTEALLDRAWVFERQLRIDQAMDDCRRALELAPDHDEATLRLGQYLITAERSPEAYPLLQPLAARRGDDPRVVLAWFRAARKLNKTEEVERLALRLRERQPAEFPILLELARHHLEQGQAVPAEAILRQAIALSPFDYQAHYSLQLCLRQLDRPEEAQKHQALLDQIDADIKQMAELTTQLQKARFDPDLRCAIARIFMRSGEEAEGLRWLKTVLQLHPRHAPTHRALADYYERRRLTHLAEHHLRLAAGAPAPP